MLVLPFCSWFLFTVTFVLFLCDFPGAHPLPPGHARAGGDGLAARRPRAGSGLGTQTGFVPP